MANGDLVQCVSCGGIYAPIQKDGTEYYHACPGRKVVGVKQAPTPEDPNATVPVYEAINNPRNENIVKIDEDGKAVIVAEGKGITPVTDPAIIAAFGADVEQA